MTYVRSAVVGMALDRTTHPGLWLDRFAKSHEQKDLSGYRRDIIEKVGVPDGYQAAYEGRLEALEQFVPEIYEGAAGETRIRSATVEGRMVVGIGTASIAETSLTLLRAWGLPFIPGSALKGLASARAHRSGDPRWARPAKPGEAAGELQRLVFGDVTSAGVVTFHDAWWVPDAKLPLAADVVTVHHKDYYSGKKEHGPMDWDEPTPVAFLTAHGEYAIAISGPKRVVDVVFELLEGALREDGVGAKTAAGYGRMKLGAVLQTRRTREKEEARETIEALIKSHEGPRTALRTADGLAKLHASGHRELVAEATRRLTGDTASRANWRAFFKGTKAKAGQAELFAAALETPAPAPAPTSAKATSVRGLAWMADREGKPHIFVKIGEAEPKNRQARKIEHASVLEELSRATPKAPLPVLVRLSREGQVEEIERTD